jgi:hypothetical protein
MEKAALYSANGQHHNIEFYDTTLTGQQTTTQARGFEENESSGKPAEHEAGINSPYAEVLFSEFYF